MSLKFLDKMRILHAMLYISIECNTAFQLSELLLGGRWLLSTVMVTILDTIEGVRLSGSISHSCLRGNRLTSSSGCPHGSSLVSELPKGKANRHVSALTAL